MPFHCQFCRKESHYASWCLDLNTFASCHSPLDANLAKDFQNQCHILNSSPDWFVDIRESAHMTSTSSTLDSATPNLGADIVVFGHGDSASISHIGKSCIIPHILLLDIVVPKHT